MSPTDIVQAQVDAYNAQDLDRMCGYYAEDCEIADYRGPVTQAGRAAVRARYAKTFADFPQNRCRIANRIAVGDTVIDHEIVDRAPGGERFEVAVIYTVRGDHIARVEFVRP